MKKSVFLAGIAALAMAGTAAWAADNVHEMTVQLPGGGVEHIEYTGNVAPKVVVQPGGIAAFPQIGFMPMAFPDFARIQAAMDQQMAQMDAMMARANAMAAQAQNGALNGPITIGTSGGATGGFCAHSVQITRDASGKENVVEKTSGTCAGSAGAAVQVSGNGAANAFCVRSVQISTGTDGKRDVVEHDSGNCAGAPNAPAPAHVTPPRNAI